MKRLVCQIQFKVLASTKFELQWLLVAMHLVKFNSIVFGEHLALAS